MSKPFKVILFGDEYDDQGRYIMPVWWKNFTRENQALSIDEVNEAGRHWNFKFYTERPRAQYGKRWAVFSSKEDFTAFVLRWS